MGGVRDKLRLEGTRECTFIVQKPRLKRFIAKIIFTEGFTAL